jgi:hypothetical protein
MITAPANMEREHSPLIDKDGYEFSCILRYASLACKEDSV